LAGSLLLTESCELGDIRPYTDVVLSGDDGESRQERLKVVEFRSKMVVVMHCWYRCRTKHPERTHATFREEASLGRGVADSVKGIYTASLIIELAFLVM
jgi:hypothetical protein